MTWHKIKRSPADILFSNYIRAKRKYTCEKCGKIGKINGITICQIEASHYISRSKRTVRFDEQNVRVLCSACHKRMGGYKREENGEYDLWIKELLGQYDYRRLIIRGNLPGQKTDKKLELLYVKQLIQKV